MTKRRQILLMLIAIATILFSCSHKEKTCSCESNFEWIKKTFEENDAGFQYIIDKKGQEVYNIHNQIILKKIKTAKTSKECAIILNEWLKFFRLGHIGVELISDSSATQKSEQEELRIDNLLKPHLEELNKTTLYLCIPSFDLNKRQVIDSVLTANRNKILKTENLIIDLRNNTGGTTRSYQSLLPFLYTNPIRIMQVEYLSTPLNNQRFIDFAHSTKDNFSEDERQNLKKYYDKLQNRLGEFVTLDDEEVPTYRCDTVYKYPKNVGIIVNKYSASCAEGFLLAARQSKKVKTFGTATYGAWDILSINSVKSPCKEFELTYSLARSQYMPDMTIDDTGIQPDYFLDKTIPQDKWVEFVNNVLNK